LTNGKIMFKIVIQPMLADTIERSGRTLEMSPYALIKNPRFVLLFDAVGATATAFATIFLLAQERIRTGIPAEYLYAMGLAAACFACFDAASLWLHWNSSVSLRIIACANLVYCGLAFVCLYSHRTSLTSLGLAYFCIEIPIVAALAIWEWRIARS
jgi:hypothetical protein